MFNVQRFTVHDGPGIRTEFFLKGCPLRCEWCGNPESYIKKPQVGVFSQRCIGVDVCGDCLKACPKNDGFMFKIAEVVKDDKTKYQVTGINRDLCDNCLECHKSCPVDALKLWGEEMTIDEAMKVILKDKEYYQKNNGGVTISGGEFTFCW